MLWYCNHDLSRETNTQSTKERVLRLGLLEFVLELQRPRATETHEFARIRGFNALNTVGVKNQSLVQWPTSQAASRWLCIPSFLAKLWIKLFVSIEVSSMLVGRPAQFVKCTVLLHKRFLCWKMRICFILSFFQSGC